MTLVWIHKPGEAPFQRDLPVSYWGDHDSGGTTSRHGHWGNLRPSEHGYGIQELEVFHQYFRWWVITGQEYLKQSVGMVYEFEGSYYNNFHQAQAARQSAIRQANAQNNQYQGEGIIADFGWNQNGQVIGYRFDTEEFSSLDAAKEARIRKIDQINAQNNQCQGEGITADFSWDQSGQVIGYKFNGAHYDNFHQAQAARQSAIRQVNAQNNQHQGEGIIADFGWNQNGQVIGYRFDTEEFSSLDAAKEARIRKIDQLNELNKCEGIVVDFGWNQNGQVPCFIFDGIRYEMFYDVLSVKNNQEQDRKELEKN